MQSYEDSIEEVSLLEKRRKAIDERKAKLDMAILALWEVRGMYRTDVPSIDSYVQTAYSAIATIQLELENHKARMSEGMFGGDIDNGN